MGTGDGVGDTPGCSVTGISLSAACTPNTGIAKTATAIMIKSNFFNVFINLFLLTHFHNLRNKNITTHHDYNPVSSITFFTLV